MVNADPSALMADVRLAGTEIKEQTERSEDMRQLYHHRY
jgi:hypothetical protein